MAFQRLTRALMVGGWAVGILAPAASSAQTTTTYTYDAQGQVRTVSRPTQTVTYAYDLAANRTSVAVAAPPTGLDAVGAAKGSVSSSTSNLLTMERPAFVFPEPPVDMIRPSPAPPAPPPPISPLTGQPLPAAAPSSGR